MRQMIRRLQAEEGSILRGLRLRALSSDPLSFGSTYSREVAFPEAYWKARAEEYAAGDDTAIFFAFVEELPVGLVRTAREAARADVFGIFSMWIAPEARQRGVATGLLATAENFARVAGGHVVELSVSDRALAASRLYTRAGYVLEGTVEETHPGVVERPMRKSLPAG